MIIPSFFKNKGKIVFLPNDIWGEVLKMWDHALTNQQQRKNYEIELIKTEELDSTFPLWKATDTVNKDPAWQTITEHQKTNGTAKTNLNQTYPIIMIYNTSSTHRHKLKTTSNPWSPTITTQHPPRPCLQAPFQPTTTET